MRRTRAWWRRAPRPLSLVTICNLAQRPTGLSPERRERSRDTYEDGDEADNRHFGNGGNGGGGPGGENQRQRPTAAPRTKDSQQEGPRNTTRARDSARGRATKTP